MQGLDTEGRKGIMVSDFGDVTINVHPCPLWRWFLRLPRVLRAHYRLLREGGSDRAEAFLLAWSLTAVSVAK